MKAGEWWHIKEIRKHAPVIVRLRTYPLNIDTWIIDALGEDGKWYKGCGPFPGELVYENYEKVT